MIVYSIFSFILWLLAVPFCMGLLFLPLLKKSQRTPGVALIAGYILQFFILELVGIPVVLLVVSLRFLSVDVLLGVSGPAFLVSIYFRDLFREFEQEGETCEDGM